MRKDKNGGQVEIDLIAGISAAEHERDAPDAPTADSDDE